MHHVEDRTSTWRCDSPATITTTITDTVRTVCHHGHRDRDRDRDRDRRRHTLAHDHSRRARLYSARATHELHLQQQQQQQWEWGWEWCRSLPSQTTNVQTERSPDQTGQRARSPSGAGGRGGRARGRHDPGISGCQVPHSRRYSRRRLTYRYGTVRPSQDLPHHISPS